MRERRYPVRQRLARRRTLAPVESRALVGRHLRRLRKEQGLSQEGLAELAGMDRSFLSLVESGKRSISVENLCRLAAALEVHPRVFLEDA